MAEAMRNLELLNQQALAEFNVIFEQLGKKFISPHECIVALAHLCVIAVNLDNDVRLPPKPFKFLQSSWLSPSLYQIVNEGLSTLHALHLSTPIACHTYELSEYMISYVRDAFALQDNTYLILVSPEFFINTDKIIQFLQDIGKQCKFKAVSSLTTELEEAVKASKELSFTARGDIQLALAKVSMSFSNLHHIWLWVFETFEQFLATPIGANKSNEFKSQTLIDAHRAACLSFQMQAVLDRCFSICKGFPDQELIMGDLIETSILEFANVREAELQCLTTQLTDVIKYTGSVQKAVILFKESLSLLEELTKTTTNGYMWIKLVKFDGDPALTVTLDDDSQTSGTHEWASSSTCNYTFPTLKPFVSTSQTVSFHIKVEDRAANVGKAKFTLDSHQLSSTEPVTLMQNISIRRTIIRTVASLTLQVSVFKSII